MPRSGSVLALAALTLLPSAGAAVCPVRPVAPAKDWSSIAEGVRAARPSEVAALEAYAFPAGLDEASRKGVRTDGLVVVHRGVVTYERYGRGFDAGTRHLSWSMAKSVTGLLAGVAVKDGALALDDSICEHLRTVPREHCDLRVRHLLEWTSGLDWQESYEHGANQASSVLAMLYGAGRDDTAAFVLSHRKRAAPGESWAYSTGDSVVLAAALGGAMEPRFGRDWPWARLFDRVSASSATFERDPKGTLSGGSLFYATPRDLARLGLLVLDDGCWAGERLVAEGYLAAASAPSPALRRRGPFHATGDVGGRSLWLNVAVPEAGLAKPWPDVPGDAVAFRGHWGQLVVVIPSLDLVVVRVGDDRETGVLDANRLLVLAIAAGRVP